MGNGEVCMALCGDLLRVRFTVADLPAIRAADRRPSVCSRKDFDAWCIANTEI
jgi:hypothetical protein